NRLARTRFSVAGVEVNLDEATTVSRDPTGLPIHGMLSAAAGWHVNRHEATDGGGLLTASFDFASHPELMAAFPVPHEALFEATRVGRTLTIRTAVSATGERQVPVSFGYRPYLRLPGVDRSEWQVEIPVSEQLELDERMLPTGRRSAVRVDAGPLGSRTFDD